MKTKQSPLFTAITDQGKPSPEEEDGGTQLACALSGQQHAAGSACAA